MALIKCSECGKDISDKATSCPACGNPLHSQVVEAVKTVEIQLTNKRWKKTTLWGLLILFIGFITLPRSIGLGIFLIFIAVIMAFVSRVGAWWTNG